MNLEGTGLTAGGVDIAVIPVPTGTVKYASDPYALMKKKSIWDHKPTVVPSAKALALLEKMGRLRVEEETAPKAKRKRTSAPAKKKTPVNKSRKGVSMAKQKRVIEAKKYLATPKICAYEPCGKTFHAREGERVDGYKRRETCSRSCAAKKAKVSLGFK